MKKVALISDPWTGAIKRAEAFIKETNKDQFNFTLVKMFRHHKDDFTLAYEPTEKFKVINVESYHQDDFDVVMTMNDKHFEYVLKKYAPQLENVIDKLTLTKTSEAFGLGKIKTSGFSNNEKVFVKPRIGAGQYSTDDFSYRPHRFGDILKANLSLDKYIIQQYIDCPVVISVTVVGNGRELEFIDVTEAYHTYDKHGKNLNSHLESMIHKKEDYSEYIQATFGFLNFIHYEKVPGIYMLQFMKDKNAIYCTDFNVRTGPVSDMMTLHHKIHRIHRMIPFIAGAQTFAEVDRPHLRYRCYLEDEGRIISPNVKLPLSPDRILLSENKNSGIIRSDYQSFLEILP